MDARKFFIYLTNETMLHGRTSKVTLCPGETQKKPAFPQREKRGRNIGRPFGKTPALVLQGSSRDREAIYIPISTVQMQRQKMPPEIRL